MKIKFQKGEQVRFPDPFKKHHWRYGIVSNVEGVVVEVEIHATKLPRYASTGDYSFKACTVKKVQVEDPITGDLRWVAVVGYCVFESTQLKRVTMGSRQSERKSF